MTFNSSPTVHGRASGLDPHTDPHGFIEEQVRIGKEVIATGASIRGITSSFQSVEASTLQALRERELAAKCALIEQNHAEALALLKGEGFLPIEQALEHVKVFPQYCGFILRIRDSKLTEERSYKPGAFDSPRSDEHSTSWTIKRRVEIKFVAIEKMPELESLFSHESSIRNQLGLHGGTRSWDNAPQGSKKGDLYHEGPSYYHIDSTEESRLTFILISDPEKGFTEVRLNNSLRNVPPETGRHNRYDYDDYPRRGELPGIKLSSFLQAHTFCRDKA